MQNTYSETTTAKSFRPQTEFHLRRGDVVMVDLQGAVGGEKQGTRPAVVLQNNEANERLDTTVVATVTSQFDPNDLYEYDVIIGADEAGLPEDSVVQIDQIRTISANERIKDIYGWLPEERMNEIEEKVKALLEV